MVPKNLVAKAYHQLVDFFKGDSDIDPRADASMSRSGSGAASKKRAGPAPAAGRPRKKGREAPATERRQSVDRVTFCGCTRIRKPRPKCMVISFASRV